MTAVNARLRRVLSIARKELRQLWRDQLTLGFVVGLPIVQLVLFGYAINQDIRHVRTALVDRSNTSISREIVGRLEATQTFSIARIAQSEEEAGRLLREGQVQAAVVFPPDFARRYYRGRGAEISMLVDASDPVLARSVRNSAQGLADVIERRIQVFDVGGPEGALRAPRQRGRFGLEPELIRDQPVRISILSYFNPELRTPIFVVPGLLGVILTTTMILMTSLAIVRERERGSFEFLIATPVRREELMIGKILPYIGIGFIQIILVLATGVILFQIPFEGSVSHLLFASLFFIAANLTLGLVISCVTKSQLQATQLSFFFFLPSVLLSGFMFPFESMPLPAQWIGELLPLTHYIRIARAVILRGAPIWSQWTEVLALLAFTAAGMALATRLFQKRLG